MQDLRNIIMNKRMVLCTGNPERESIANGVKQLYPDATFIHKSNDYNLKDMTIEELQKVKDVMSKHNCFINASYIDKGVQTELLNLYFESVKMGEVFNIGSTHEYDGLSKDQDYVASKTELRAKSLELNNFRINTTHIILGHKETITPIRIAQLIKWITEQEMKYPILGFDAPKEAW